MQKHSIAVVIPTFKARSTILDVLSSIPQAVGKIYVVDDQCPQSSGDLVEQQCEDSRVVVIRHKKNQGVGGAVKTGYQAAFSNGATIVVKIDSDGQMDPALIPSIVTPIQNGVADYVKGNRFFNPDDVKAMPLTRLIGNAGLSFLTKISSGYWSIFDPTNGFTALHRTAFKQLPLDKISDRYFFETDMLFRLNIASAVVQDMPMRAVYDGEHSSLSVFKSLFEFSYKHVKNLFKRLFYKYFLRDFGPGSISLVFGLVLLLIALTFGISQWANSIATGTPATSGTVVLSALLFIISFQLLMAFATQDYTSAPSTPLQKLFPEP